jgi:hypothetical protein
MLNRIICFFILILAIFSASTVGAELKCLSVMRQVDAEATTMWSEIKFVPDLYCCDNNRTITVNKKKYPYCIHLQLEKERLEKKCRKYLKIPRRFSVELARKVKG